MNKFSKETVKSINLDLSNVCNLQCPCCDRYLYQKIELNSGHISLNRLILTLDQFPNLEELILIGNISEPTLYKDLKGLKLYLNERDIPVYISTNGMSDLNTYKWLIENSIDGDEIRFCVDGTTEEIHQRYRKGSKLSKVLDNIRTCLDIPKEKRKAKVSIQYLLFHHNHNIKDENGFSDSDKIHDFIEEHVNCRLPVHFIKADVQWGPSQVTYSGSTSGEIIQNSVESVKHEPLNKIETFFKPDKYSIKDIQCECHSVDFNNINITYDGTVYPCCYIMDIPNEEEIFQGMKKYNVYKDDLDVIIYQLNKYMERIAENKACFLTCSKLARQFVGKGKRDEETERC